MLVQFVHWKVLKLVFNKHRVCAKKKKADENMRKLLMHLRCKDSAREESDYDRF